MAGNLESSRETFIKHYRKHYDDPFLPPIWAVVETLSFGELSRWFKATKDIRAKMDVARRLGFPTAEIAEGVLHAITPVRNICAHHGRLWNRRLTLQLPRIKRLAPQMQMEAPRPSSCVTQQTGTAHPVPQQSHRPAPERQHQPSRALYNYLLVMAHIMNQISPRSSWKQRLQDLVQTRTAQEKGAMGFPPDWESQPVWGLKGPADPAINTPRSITQGQQS
ncbi:MAG: Abi family protein [Lautropia sp.]|nr:Abi family protein [Lautropia sp.]